MVSFVKSLFSCCINQPNLNQPKQEIEKPSKYHYYIDLEINRDDNTREIPEDLLRKILLYLNNIKDVESCYILNKAWKHVTRPIYNRMYFQLKNLRCHLLSLQVLNNQLEEKIIANKVASIFHFHKKYCDFQIEELINLIVNFNKNKTNNKNSEPLEEITKNEDKVEKFKLNYRTMLRESDKDFSGTDTDEINDPNIKSNNTVSKYKQYRLKNIKSLLDEYKKYRNIKKLSSQDMIATKQISSACYYIQKNMNLTDNEPLFDQLRNYDEAMHINYGIGGISYGATGSIYKN